MNTRRSQVDELQSTLNEEQKNPVDLDATALVGADGRPAELMSVDTWYLLSSSSLKGAKNANAFFWHERNSHCGQKDSMPSQDVCKSNCQVHCQVWLRFDFSWTHLDIVSDSCVTLVKEEQVNGKSPVGYDFNQLFRFWKSCFLVTRSQMRKHGTDVLLKIYRTVFSLPNVLECVGFHDCQHGIVHSFLWLPKKLFGKEHTSPSEC
jgi:hypothetical protein